MASGIMSEAILIIASVVIATSIAGVVMSQVGVFESTFTSTTENQKDIILTKVKIVYVTNTTDNHVSVWVKNIGMNPISAANKTDVYFGEINQVQNILHNSKQQNDNTWKWDAPLPQPIWQISDTHSINITDADLRPGVTYQVTVTTPNGVTDEQIFSILGN
jgi:archaeal flagellar protein FlaG